VNRETGLIPNVLVCGKTSENGRSYPWGGALKCDPKKYEGRPVNLNHASAGTVERSFGWLENVTVDDEGRPRADLRINPEHPYAKSVFWYAENRPQQLGLSHVAVCRTRMERGVEVIEEIQSVESVDLVSSPATTKGLYESLTMKRKLIPLLEALAGRRPAAGKWAKSRILREMDDAYADGMDGMPAPEEIGDTADATSAGITDAFTSAAMALVSDLMMKTDDAAAIKAGLGKLKKLLLAHGDINGDGKVDAADMDAAVDDADADNLPAMESKGAKHVLAVIESLAALKVAPTKANIEAVGHIPPEHRATVLKTLAESVAVRPGEKPTTTGRTPPAKLTEEANAAAAAQPKIGEYKFG